MLKYGFTQKNYKFSTNDKLIMIFKVSKTKQKKNNGNLDL